MAKEKGFGLCLKLKIKAAFVVVYVNHCYMVFTTSQQIKAAALRELRELSTLLYLTNFVCF